MTARPMLARTATVWPVHRAREDGCRHDSRPFWESDLDPPWKTRPGKPSAGNTVFWGTNNPSLPLGSAEGQPLSATDVTVDRRPP